MFNVSNSFKPRISESELLNATHDAIDQTIELLEKRHNSSTSQNSGKSIHPDSITSRTHSELVFKKLFFNHKQYNDFFDMQWLRKVYRISELRNRKSFSVEEILPEAVYSSIRVTNTFKVKLQPAFRLFFYVLYCNKAILLSPNYRPPKTLIDKAPFDPIFHLYPPLLKLFRQDFTRPFPYQNLASSEIVVDSPSILEHIRETEHNNVRDSAYKIFICTDWYEARHIAPEELFEFAKACYVAQKTSPEIVVKTLPIRSALTALLALYPDKCLFEQRDLKLLETLNRKDVVIQGAKNTLSSVNSAATEDGSGDGVGNGGGDNNGSRIAFSLNTTDNLLFLANESSLIERNIETVNEISEWQTQMGKTESARLFSLLPNKLLNADWLNEVFTLYREKYVNVEHFRSVFSIADDQEINLSRDELYEVKELIALHLLKLQSEKLLALPLSFKSETRKTRLKNKPTTFFSELYNCFAIEGDLNSELSEFISAEQRKDIDRYVIPVICASNMTSLADLTPTNITRLFDQMRGVCHHLQITTFLYALKSILDWRFEVCPYSYKDIGIFLLPNTQLTTSLLEEHASLSGSSITESWLHYEKLYIDSMKRRGISSYATVEKELGRFNRYLFIDLVKEIGEENIPKNPSELKRSHLTGTDKLVGFMDSLIKELSADYAYSIILHIDQFFTWLESFKGEHDVKEFINPINDLDYPLLKRSRGTNKEVFPKEAFTNIHSFVFSLCEFYWYMIENDLYVPDAANRKNCFSTEELGFVPIVYLDGKIHYLTHIPCTLTTEELTQKDGKDYFYPTFQGLFQCLVALETGLRHIHIRWLSADNYNKFLSDDEDNMGQLNIHESSSHDLNVNTDKSKLHHWKSIVSHRVILTLHRLRKFLSSVAQDIPEVWYNGHENSPHGKIKSLFATPSISGDTAPYSEGSFKSIYRRIQYFFDLFVLQNAPDVKPLNGLPKGLKKKYESYQKEKLTKPQVLAEMFFTRAKYKTKYTPHGTRATVASDKVKVLPPWVVAEYITGHESLAVFAHYVKVDPDFIRKAGDYSKDFIFQNELFSDKTKQDLMSSNEQVIKNLQLVVQNDPSLLEKQFGAVSFSSETGVNKFASGMNIIHTTPVSNLSFMATHICPFNGVCPDDVKKDFGEMRCGPCYYSIKTVDHIPRILAEIRKLVDDLLTTQETLADAKTAGADKVGLQKLEKQKQDLGLDLSAWITTYEILKVNLSKLKSDDEANKPFVVAKPDILLNKLEEIQLKDTSINDLLLRIKDAGNFQEYYTPNLKAKLTQLKNKILINTGQLEKLLIDAPAYQLVDELRGLISSFCVYEDISVPEALKRLSQDFDAPTADLRLLGAK